MRKKKKITGLITYTLILFFSIIGFIYAANNSQQISETGGTKDINTAGEKDGVEISKTISPTDTENFFDITLTVKTDTNIKQELTSPDIAVVLVMDVSKTMVDNKMGTQTRLEVAKQSAKDFVQDFYNYSKDENSASAIRKIGFVTFSTNSSQIYGLSDCKTLAQKNDMDTKITAIQASTGEKTQWTNMEAGLARAKNMLSKSAAKNKYIIFLTDGLPTTYSKTVGGNTGYYPVTAVSDPRPTTAKLGLFYNFQRKLFATGGTNYSDMGARRAEEQAKIIRDSGTKIFSIGVGISSQPTMYDLLTRNYNTVDTDTEANNYNYYKNTSPYRTARYYAILPGVTVPSTNIKTNTSVKNQYNNQNRTQYKNWLKNYIGSNSYYDSDDKDALANAYKEIFKEITEELKKSTEATWVAEDPMGTDNSVKNIEFLGFYNNDNLQSSITTTVDSTQVTLASFANNKITWDLKDAPFTTSKVEDTTYYTYKLVYRVRLKNELSSFVENKIYKTNGTTSLTYVVREKNETTNEELLSDDKKIIFPEPSVLGYYSDLSFTKVSSYNALPLEGVKFELTHSSNCSCKDGYKNLTGKSVSINKFTVTSDANGLVIFNNIPSGHDYILTETTPIDHKDATQIIVNVDYDKVTTTPEIGKTLINQIKTANLEIKKTVRGNDSKPGKFKFTLNGYFKEKNLTGTYKYILNKKTEGTIEFIDGKGLISGTKAIELGASETIIIYDLPVGATYKLTETTTDGYKVQYEVNSTGEKLGNIAICNAENNCRLEEGNVNTVEFINTAAYILPATGSSGMLILAIIGTLLLIVPVIYIGYSIYQNKRSRA